jgi:hypothetical protein
VPNTETLAPVKEVSLSFAVMNFAGVSSELNLPRRNL